MGKIPFQIPALSFNTHCPACTCVYFCDAVKVNSSGTRATLLSWPPLLPIRASPTLDRAAYACQDNDGEYCSLGQDLSSMVVVFISLFSVISVLLSNLPNTLEMVNT